MATIQAIFDGKTFIPKEPVALPADSEVEITYRSEADREAWMDRLNAETRADYEKFPPDEEDEAWGRFAGENARLMWEELDREEAADDREKVTKGEA